MGDEKKKDTATVVLDDDLVREIIDGKDGKDGEDGRVVRIAPDKRDPSGSRPDDETGG